MLQVEKYNCCTTLANVFFLCPHVVRAVLFFLNVASIIHFNYLLLQLKINEQKVFNIKKIKSIMVLGGLSNLSQGSIQSPAVNNSRSTWTQQACFDTDLKPVAAMLYALKTEKAMEELRRTRPLPTCNREFVYEIMCSKEKENVKIPTCYGFKFLMIFIFF